MAKRPTTDAAKPVESAAAPKLRTGFMFPDGSRPFCPIMSAGDSYLGCIADRCAAWRWEPLLADGAFAEAVRKAIAETDPPRRHAEAVEVVRSNRAAYGIPTEPFRGWCGLAGKPEV